MSFKDICDILFEIKVEIETDCNFANCRDCNCVDCNCADCNTIVQTTDCSDCYEDILQAVADCINAGDIGW